jgi:hypothetical protein
MLVLRALLLLATYDIIVGFGSFQIVCSTVRRWEVASTLKTRTTIDSVLRAINYACIWYPKRALCLQRSFVVTYLLRRSGISAEMVLGACRMPFRAHAWVEVNGRAINDKAGTNERYAVWERC